MYEFLRIQYINKKITAEKLQTFVPKWITQEQCDEILAIPGVNPV